MSPRIAVLARCLGLSVLCLGLSLGCKDSGTPPQPPPEVESVVDAAASTVAVDRPTGVVANGVDTAVVTVTALRKGDNSRLSGRAVSVTVEGASVQESALVTDINGEARAHVLATEPGVKTVKASVKDDTGKMVALSQTATVEFVNVSTVKTLAFRSALPDAVAGEPLKLLVVEVRDGAGAVVTDSTAEVTLSLGSGGIVFPEGLLTVTAVNGVATFPDVVLNRAGGGYHFVASAPGFEPVASTFFKVVPGPVKALGYDRFLDTVTVGVAESLEVTLADAHSNTVTDYTGTVTLTSTDAAATLPSHTFTAADAGTFKFQGITFRTPGPQFLTIADSAGAFSFEMRVMVSAAATASLAFTPQPSNGNADSALPDVKVSLLDARGDVVSTATSVVTLTLTGQPGFTAVDVAAVNGVATFSGLRVTTAGTFTFTATVGALTRESQPFTVGAGAVAKLVLAAFTDPVDAGDENDVTVTVTDAFGNRRQDYAGTVRFTSSDTQAVLPADATFVPEDAGQKTVSGLVFKTAGARTLTATDTATPALTATVDVEVRASAAASFEVIASTSPVAAGQSLGYELVARDAWGNVAKDYASTVTFSSTDAQAVLPGAYTFTLVDEGRHTFSVTLRTAGAQGVTAEDVADPSLTATHTFTVGAAAANHLVFVSAPTTGSVRQDLADIEVAVQDAFGNTVTGASVDVQLALAGGSFAQGLPTRSTVDGVATFSGLSVNDEGTYPLQASADGFQAVTSGDLVISDAQAPAAAAGFSATAVDGASIRLDWQAPGDDGALGTAAQYELRYATSALDDATFGAATLVTGVGAPQTAGTAESFTVSGLTAGTTYFFALKTFDGAGNASVLATASAATTDPCSGYVCTPPAPQCAEDGYSREVYASVCVVRNGAPACVDGDTTLETCTGADAVCYAGACTTAPHPGAGELVISEVMHSPSTGTTEYLELTNTTSHLLDAQGLSVTLVNSVGTETSFTVNHNPTLLVPPGGRTVLAQDANFTRNGGVAANTDYGVDKFMDSTGSITLKQGTVTVDSLTYTSAFPQGTGRAMSLASSIIGTKGSGRAWYWCESTGSLSGGDRGTPGQLNDDCGLNVEKPVNWCAIQYPKTFPSPDNTYPAIINTGASYDIYSQFYSYDVTEQNTKGNDFYPLIEAQLGYGTDATNPAGWTWTAADFNPGYTTPGSNNDEMKAVLQIPTAGTYSYGFRYRFKGEEWVYCDQSGKVQPPAGTYGSVTVVKPPLTNHVVISEFASKGPGSTPSNPNHNDEFIELYNPTNAAVNLSGWKIQYKSDTGTSYANLVVLGTATIAAHGYYLIAGPGYTGTVTSNASYASGTSHTAGHIRIGPGSLGTAVNDAATVDKLAWGTGANSPEGSAPAAYLSDPAWSLERKAVSTSTPASMDAADALRGNGLDTDQNGSDFVIRTTRNPQNASSPLEFY
ncbi:lamin tail domain-containing protein [Corallococcus interemptor]|uniref:lamin tail domain-containing protein n=1 Tax=Corallococcus interemptor TaxID=2316720 RepID=UPI003D0870A3